MKGSGFRVLKIRPAEICEMEFLWRLQRNITTGYRGAHGG